MQEISHLVVNGCSWTYGAELDDPATQAWPAIVSKKLGLPIVNLAIGGSSNPSIYRRTTEYLFKNLPYGSKPFVIIAWSQNTRNEAWIKEKKDYFGLGCLDPRRLSLAEKSHLYNWNEEDHFRRSLLCKVNMISVLQNLNIPFIIGDYENSDSDFFREFDKTGSVQNRFSEMINFVKENPRVWKTPLIDYCNHTKKQPFGHEGIEGHQIIEKEVIKFFNLNYNQYKHVDLPYLTFKDYRSKMGLESMDYDSVWEN